MVQATQGEVEQHTQALQAVRMKLAPWERQMGEVRSRMGVATSERDLLQKAHAQAQERFEVGTHPQPTVSDAGAPCFFSPFLPFHLLAVLLLPWVRCPRRGRCALR